MNSRKRRFTAVLLAVLVLLCAACDGRSGAGEALEETVVDLTDIQTKHDMFLAREERDNNWDGIIEFNLYTEYQSPYWGYPFSVENAQGQYLHADGYQVRGTMPLLEGGKGIRWYYVVPMSDYYRITIDDLPGRAFFALSGGYNSTEKNRHLGVYFTGLHEIDFYHEKIQLTGTDMTYEVKTPCDYVTLWGIEATGSGESQLSMRVEEGGFLLRGKDAPCHIIAICRDEESRQYEREDLGQSPAGRWVRITLTPEGAAMTVEPRPRWPWLAACGGILLIAALCGLLIRRKRKSMRFQEDNSAPMDSNTTVEQIPEEGEETQ